MTCSFSGEFEAIPDNIRGGLERYVAHHIKPGGFLSAVILGELFEAVRRADPESRKAIPLIALWLEQNCPDLCGAVNMANHLSKRDS